MSFLFCTNNPPNKEKCGVFNSRLISFSGNICHGSPDDYLVRPGGMEYDSGGCIPGADKFFGDFS